MNAVLLQAYVSCKCMLFPTPGTIRPLLQICYPLFVYTYLMTVREKHGMHARDMLNQLKPRFLQSESSSMSVAKELEDLSTVIHPQHLQSPVPRAVRHHPRTPSHPCFSSPRE
jgi:WD40 associated region in TFIID subunit, NTD2 domain